LAQAFWLKTAPPLRLPVLIAPRGARGDQRRPPAERMVLFGEDHTTKFSYIEYQALMLGLAGGTIAALGAVEVALSRFQVLPLIFPGMFSVRERRFYFFSFDISDGAIGKQVRAEAKMLIRISVFLVLSYLWQHCVLETTQQVGTDFPTQQCKEELDCFASELDFVTLFDRGHIAIDCEGNSTGFDERVVVSCIRFIPPSATTWLMHLAIAHSVTQLNFKCFELLVWIGGNSSWVRTLLRLLILVSLAAFSGLFFGGVMSEFVSSWLSFVMSLTIPMFIYVAWRSSTNLEKLWKDDSVKVQRTLEEHLNAAFTDIEAAIAREAIGDDAEARETVERRCSRKSESSDRPRTKVLVGNIRGLLSGIRKGSRSFGKKIKRGSRSRTSEINPPEKHSLEKGYRDLTRAGKPSDDVNLSGQDLSGEEHTTEAPQTLDVVNRASRGKRNGASQRDSRCLSNVSDSL